MNILLRVWKDNFQNKPIIQDQMIIHIPPGYRGSMEELVKELDMSIADCDRIDFQQIMRIYCLDGREITEDEAAHIVFYNSGYRSGMIGEITADEMRRNHR